MRRTLLAAAVMMQPTSAIEMTLREHMKRARVRVCACVEMPPRQVRIGLGGRVTHIPLQGGSDDDDDGGSGRLIVGGKGDADADTEAGAPEHPPPPPPRKKARRCKCFVNAYQTAHLLLGLALPFVPLAFSRARWTALMQLAAAVLLVATAAYTHYLAIPFHAAWGCYPDGTPVDLLTETCPQMHMNVTAFTLQTQPPLTYAFVVAGGVYVVGWLFGVVLLSNSALGLGKAETEVAEDVDDDGHPFTRLMETAKSVERRGAAHYETANLLWLCGCATGAHLWYVRPLRWLLVLHYPLVAGLVVVASVGSEGTTTLALLVAWFTMTTTPLMRRGAMVDAYRRNPDAHEAVALQTAALAPMHVGLRERGETLLARAHVDLAAHNADTLTAAAAARRRPARRRERRQW